MVVLLLVVGPLSAESKRSLKGNRQLSYAVLPGEVEQLAGLFEEGVVYGRLRTNFFYYEWDEEATGERKDNGSMGVGGSLLYKTAVYRGFGLTVGMYASTNPFYRMDREDIGLLKAGKDVLPRYDVSRGGSYSMYVLGQAYADWQVGGTGIRAGRQLFESVFTASNDTKMIPNTFDGLTLRNEDLAGTTLRAAYFTRQKLRDHERAHDVITFRNAAGESWGNNDDSAVHKGLSYQNFVAAGEDPEHDLWIVTGKNNSVDRLTVEASGLLVPDVLGNLVLEGGYRIELGAGTFTPSVRYMVQLDEGGGAIGGASLNGNVSAGNPRGYTDPDSLDASMLAIRGVWRGGDGVMQVKLGYTDIADEADLVTPWRGFPTGGYTRAMGQYNWRANTQTWMLEVKTNLDKAEWVPGLSTTLRYAVMDFDEAKGFTDRTMLHVDFIQQIPWVADLEGRLRLGFADDDGASSYNEYRLEFNYLF